MASLRFLTLTLWFISCQTVKPYEKEYLLDSLMEEKAMQASPFTLSCLAAHEKLTGGGSAASSTSCPTCGG